jgi:hypothetical protein
MQKYRCFVPAASSCEDVYAEDVYEAWVLTGKQLSCIIKIFREYLHQWEDVCRLDLTNEN